MARQFTTPVRTPPGGARARRYLAASVGYARKERSFRPFNQFEWATSGSGPSRRRPDGRSRIISINDDGRLAGARPNPHVSRRPLTGIERPYRFANRWADHCYGLISASNVPVHRVDGGGWRVDGISAPLAARRCGNGLVDLLRFLRIRACVCRGFAEGHRTRIEEGTTAVAAEAAGKLAVNRW